MVGQASSSEMYVHIYQTTCCHIPGDSNLHSDCYESLKSHSPCCLAQSRPWYHPEPSLMCYCCQPALPSASWPGINKFLKSEMYKWLFMPDEREQSETLYWSGWFYITSFILLICLCSFFYIMEHICYLLQYLFISQPRVCDVQ